jgi:hypothetical protein
VEKFRRLALEGVADELENPSDDEQSQRVEPKPMQEDAGDKKRNRKQDGRDAQGVTDAVYRMLMTGAVLRNPLLVVASAQHANDDIRNVSGKNVPRKGLATRFCGIVDLSRDPN